MSESKKIYYVITGKDQWALAEKVTKFINDGWKLAGGVVVDAKGMFYQAVYTEN